MPPTANPVTISKAQLKKLIEAPFETLKKKFASHAFLLKAVQWVEDEADTVGLDAAVKVAQDLGWVVTD